MVAQDILPFIYNAKEDKRYYEPLLNFIAQYMDAEKGALQIEDLRQQKVLSGGVYLGYDSSDLKTYHDYYSLIEPWTPRFIDKIKSTHLPFVKSDDVMHLKHYCATEFYNEWARPLDVKHSLACALQLTDDLSLKICVKRGGDRAFDKSDIHRANQLWPYLNQLLYSMKSASVLENPGTPYWVVNTKGKIIKQSESGFSDQASFYTSVTNTNKLQFNANNAQQVLERSQKTLLLGMSLLPAKIQLSTDCYAILQEYQTSSSPVGSPEKCLLIYLKFLPPLANLMMSYNLSEKRATLLQTLLSGENLQYVAKQLNVSIHTVRNGLKQLFSVVGVNSQSELIQAVSMRLAQPFEAL